jgi:UDP-3-O-[3-hydroxymyristoyl] glucosamine N-acyltransferase
LTWLRVQLSIGKISGRFNWRGFARRMRQKVEGMKLGQLSAALGLELRGDAELEISAAVPLEAAMAGTISFVSQPRYLAMLERVAPSCLIIAAELAARAQCAALISSNPALDFARALEILHPPQRPPAGIDPTAHIAPDAQIGPEASIGAFVVIGAGVKIGARAVIHPQVTIYPKVSIGNDFVCHSQVSIREQVVIGDRVVLHNGAVIGSEGFGFVPVGEGLAKIPQVGNVVLESDVEIGANTSIDRATVGSTYLRRGVKLDNLIHIGHNCDIGAYSRFAAFTGIAGSTKVGEWCEFGGQTGVADHVTIGNRVRVAAQSGIPGNIVGDNITISGAPAIEIKRWRRQMAAYLSLPELVKRIRALERKVGIAGAGDGE